MKEKYIAASVLKDYYTGDMIKDDMHVPIPVILQNIEDVPAENVVPVMYAKREKRYGNRWVCSNCHSVVHCVRYCEFCGARMLD